MTTSRWWVVTGALLVAWACPSRVSAQTRCASSARVEALEAHGMHERVARRDGAALALFQQAYELCHGARALARMGLAEKALSRWVTAEAHLSAALDTRNDPWIVANRASLAGELERVRDHLGTLMLTGAGPEADVWIGDERVGAWPTETALRVAAGTVTVSIRARDHAPVTYTLQVVARETVRQTVTLATEVEAPRVAAVSIAPPVPRVVSASAAVLPPDASAAPSDEYRRVSNTYRILGGVSAGVSLAVLTATIVTHVIRESEINTANDAYQSPSSGCAPVERVVSHCAQVHQPADDADRNLTPWVIAGYVTAGAFAVTSAVLFAIPASRSREPRATSWVCGGGPGTIGVACGATF